PVRAPASIMASAMRSFMLPVGLALSSLIRMRAQPSGTMSFSASIGVPPIRPRIEEPMRGSLATGAAAGAAAVMAGLLHVSTLYVNTYIHAATQAGRRPQAGCRRARAGRVLRGPEHPSRRAPDLAFPGGANAGNRPQSRPVRAESAYRGRRRRHDRRAGGTARPRPVDAVAEPARARARGAGRDRRRGEGPAASRGVADGAGCTPPRGRDPALAAGA